MDAFKLVRIVHCAMHMHWDEVTQALCNAYSPVHIAHSLAPNVQCVCVVGCNSVHWAHCTVYIRQYPLRSVDYRVRVRSEMGSHQFRGSSHDPRLLNRHYYSPIILIHKITSILLIDCKSYTILHFPWIIRNCLFVTKAYS